MFLKVAMCFKIIYLDIGKQNDCSEITFGDILLGFAITEFTQEIQAVIQFTLIHRPQFGLSEERLRQVYIQREVDSGRACGVGVR